MSLVSLENIAGCTLVVDCAHGMSKHHRSEVAVTTWLDNSAGIGPGQSTNPSRSGPVTVYVYTMQPVL